MTTKRGYTPTTVAAVCAASPRPQAFHLHRDSMDAVEVLGSGPSASGTYALRLTHKPCRMVAGADTVLYVRQP